MAFKAKWEQMVAPNRLITGQALVNVLKAFEKNLLSKMNKKAKEAKKD